MSVCAYPLNPPATLFAVGRRAAFAPEHGEADYPFGEVAGGVLAFHHKERKERVHLVLDVTDELTRLAVGIPVQHFKTAKTVQLFSKEVDEVCCKEANEVAMPKATKWATLKAAESKLTERQIDALAEVDAMDLQTAEKWRIKELLRWVRRAPSLRAAK